MRKELTATLILFLIVAFGCGGQQGNTTRTTATNAEVEELKARVSTRCLAADAYCAEARRLINVFNSGGLTARALIIAVENIPETPPPSASSTGQQERLPVPTAAPSWDPGGGDAVTLPVIGINEVPDARHVEAETLLEAVDEYCRTHKDDAFCGPAARYAQLVAAGKIDPVEFINLVGAIPDAPPAVEKETEPEVIPVEEQRETVEEETEQAEAPPPNPESPPAPEEPSTPDPECGFRELPLPRLENGAQDSCLLRTWFGNNLANPGGTHVHAIPTGSADFLMPARFVRGRWDGVKGFSVRVADNHENCSSQDYARDSNTGGNYSPPIIYVRADYDLREIVTPFHDNRVNPRLLPDSDVFNVAARCRERQAVVTRQLGGPNGWTPESYVSQWHQRDTHVSRATRRAEFAKLVNDGDIIHVFIHDQTRRANLPSEHVSAAGSADGWEVIEKELCPAALQRYAHDYLAGLDISDACNLSEEE